MLYLTIICVVCAVSALSEGTPLFSLKYKECHIFCHFNERGQSPGESSTPRLCNIDVNVFPNCAKAEKTSKKFLNDYFKKQYHDNNNSYCSYKKEFFPAKKENSFSKASLASRKRNLLWTNKGQKEVRSSKLKYSMGDKKLKKYHPKIKWLLGGQVKKQIVRLKQVKHIRKKRKAKKIHLDKVKVSEALDIDKRIKKLVNMVAMENIQTEKSSDLTTESVTETTSGKSGINNRKAEHSTEIKEFIPFLKNIKRIFRFSKVDFNNKKRNDDIYISSVSPMPVKNVRGKKSVLNIHECINVSNTLKNLKKSARFRRNPEIFFSKYPYERNTKYRNKLKNTKSRGDELNTLKNFLYPHSNKVTSESKRKKRKNWKLSQRHLRSNYFNNFITRNARQGIYDTERKQSYRNLIDTEEKVTTELFSGTFDNRKIHQKISEKTTFNFHKNLEQNKKSHTIKVPSDEDFGETKESLTETNFEKVPYYILEKPGSQTSFNDSEWKHETVHSNNEKLYTVTGVPSYNFSFYKNKVVKLPYNKNLTPFRYLQIRHALRNYLIHNEVWHPAKRSLMYGRIKRCGGKCNAMPHKCWRSAPLLCIPYIRKGQDELLKYIIKTLQKMLGKPFSQKVDIFEKTKFKPSAKKQPENTCEDIMPNEEESETDNEFISSSPTPESYSTPCFSSTTTCPPLMTTCPTPMMTCPSSTTTCPTPTTTCLPSTTTCPTPTTTCSPPTTTCPTPTTTCSPPTTTCPTPTTSCSPSTTTCPTPTTTCPPSTTTCPTPTTSCPSPTTTGSPLMTTYPTLTTTYIPPTTLCSPTTTLSIFDTCPTTPRSFPTTPNLYQTTCPPKPYPTLNPFPPPSNVKSTTMPYHFGTTCNEKVTSIPSNSHVSQMMTELNYHTSLNPMSMSAHPNPYVIQTTRKVMAPISYSALTQTSSALQYPISSQSLPPVPTPNHTPPLSFAANTYSAYQSKSTYEPVEYLSYTTVPFSEFPNHSSMSYQSPSKNSQTPINQQPSNILNQKAQKQVSYSIYSVSMENTTPQLTTMSYMAISESIEYDLEDIDKPNPTLDFERGQKRQFTEDLLGADKRKIINKNPRKVSESWKNFNSDGPKSSEFNNHNFQQDKSIGYKIKKNNEDFHQKLKKARRHKGVSKLYQKPIKEFGVHHYDFYNKYPFMRSINENNIKYVKYPTPWLFNNSYNKKRRKKAEKIVSKRQKRGDNYYSQIVNKKNYNDFFYDTNHNRQPDSWLLDSNIEKCSGIPDTLLKENSDMTPPSYAMFSELAMAVTESGNTTTNSTNVANSTTSIIVTEENFKQKFTTQMSDIFMGRRKYIKGKNSPPSIFSFSDALWTTPMNSTNFTGILSANTSTTPLSSAKPTIAVKTETTSIQSVNVNTSHTDCKTNGQSTENHKAEFGKLKQESENNPEISTGEEGQMPTTLKFASIVKGPKKLFIKPSPKIYTKVYPDSVPNESWTYETTIKTSLTPKPSVEKTSLAQVSAVPDVRLQLLAVCEGYLEVVKLIKAQNQSLEEELDSDLSRYCENIISQSFNLPSDNILKHKKTNVIPSTLISNSNIDAKSSSASKLSSSFYSKLNFDNAKPRKEINYRELRGKIVVDILSSPVYKRELAAKIGKVKTSSKIEKSKRTASITTNKKPIEEVERKLRNGKMHHATSRQSIKSRKRFRRKEEINEEHLKNETSKEQVELLHLLRKRKRALLSWLLSSKEDQIKPYDMQETEYLDDDDYVMHHSEPSDKIVLKDNKDRSKNETSFVNETVFPVYAKQYGYDKGGEVREVEVLWRKINEKTHERKIFKNLSVLALLLTSTNMPNMKHEKAKFVGSNGYENEEVLEVKSKSDNKVGFADSLSVFGKTDTTTATTLETDRSSEKNETHIFTSKPDPSSMVGTPNSTTVYSNTTHKISHKLGAAKDVFQEYTIEFLNYAVYILPIMFTILFLFCCMCCFLQVIKNKKGKKKRKKKYVSTDDDSESTEEFEPEKKKKKRNIKHKKQLKSDADIENLEKKRSKTFWNVLKLNSRKSSSEFNEENNHTEKKRSFLRFLKGKKNNEKSEEPYSSELKDLDQDKIYSNREIKEDKKYNDLDEQSVQQENKKEKKEKTIKIDDENEAKDRQELIALLEELKKIETENVAEKKGQKSVYVQYMTQEEDDNVFKNPSHPYFLQHYKYFPIPGTYPFCSKHFCFQEHNASAIQNSELYEDNEEMTELIPNECNFYFKKKDPAFQINRGGTSQRFFKILRDSEVIHKPIRELNFMKSRSEEKSYIFNKYRSISTDTSDELIGGTRNNMEKEIALTDNLLKNMPTFSLPPKKKNEVLKDMNKFKQQLDKKKYIRLKDDGVCCRL